MESRTEGDARKGGEVGIVSFGGKEFRSGGAVVADNFAIAYPKFPEGRDYVGARGTLEAWSGAELGTCRIVASWPVRSFIGSRMFQIEGTIDGVTYTGRGFGHGMAWKGRRKAVRS